MSDPVTALAGREAAHRVTIRDAGPRGMVTLRGDLEDPRILRACKALTGCAMPDQTGAVLDGDTGLLWMSPDELLLLVPCSEAGAAVDHLSDALRGMPHLAVDVSDARQIIALDGAGLREVLARLTPADLHPDALAPGTVRRTRLSQAAAAFWLISEEKAEVMCFRSVAHYVFGLLDNAAQSPEAGLF
ncbi:MAG: sarcosine oxidase gamma subunit SoxG [Rhodobacteraceae bacterium HLUCCA08]|nr:MAG: sarcosine oxidase gamma subunit SoxG [Rhodobacteraceae bacterium HLUCCA08]